MKHPWPIRDLIDAFMILPGIGRRTAEKFAYSLLQKNADEVANLANHIAALQQSLQTCQRCGQFSEMEICSICGDKNRDKSQLCIVNDGRYILPLEQTGHYRGLYYCLGTVVNPMETLRSSSPNLNALLKRLKENGLKEILLAFDMDTVGDATAFYVKKIIVDLKLPLKVTRLARGLSTGAQLEYADESTLISALDGRREV